MSESMALGAAEGRSLLRLARAAIADRLEDTGSLDRALGSITVTPALEAPRAVFVTLKIVQHVESLRGCIGTMDASIALFRNVIAVAPRAATEDPRFPPLSSEELDRVTLEVSALTPLEPLEQPSRLELGRDGVQLEHAGRRALFLPQVGRERDWSVEQFLGELARKAGLAAEAWREAQLRVFRVEAFRE